MEDRNNKKNKIVIISILCIVLILMWVIMFVLKKDKVDNNQLNLVNGNVSTNEQLNNASQDSTSEEDARNIAVNKFKELGESDVIKDKLSVKKIKKKDGEYYYISSVNNTLEIRIADGAITRINSVKVKE